MHVNEKAKKEVKRILIRKEVRLILYPLSISIFLYGLWMFSFSSIMGNFKCMNSLLHLLIITKWVVYSCYYPSSCCCHSDSENVHCYFVQVLFHWQYGQCLQYHF